MKLTKITLGFVMVLSTGCKEDYWFGTGKETKARAGTPSGVQSGEVFIPYTLSGVEPESDVSVSFSTDGGGTFQSASPGSGGEGTMGLSVTSEGADHLFVWDSAKDIDGERFSSVMVRIQPKDGRSARTENMTVHNARFLLMARKVPAGRSAGDLDLYYKPSIGADYDYLSTIAPVPGEEASDILCEGGIFYVAYPEADQIVVLYLDEENVLGGGPGNLDLRILERFPGQGHGPKRLATDGRFLFVSNRDNAVGVLDIDPSTGKLRINSHSWEKPLTVKGCRSMAVVGSRLYVGGQKDLAGGPKGTIRAFQISEDGELFEMVVHGDPGSPGLSVSLELAAVGDYLYAARPDDGSLWGFRLEEDGGLATLEGFSIPLFQEGIENMASDGTNLNVMTVSGLFLSFAMSPSGSPRPEARALEAGDSAPGDFVRVHSLPEAW